MRSQAQLCDEGTTDRTHLGCTPIFLWVPESHTLTWSHLLKIIGWQRFPVVNSSWLSGLGQSFLFLGLLFLVPEQRKSDYLSQHCWDIKQAGNHLDFGIMMQYPWPPMSSPRLRTLPSTKGYRFRGGKLSSKWPSLAYEHVRALYLFYCVRFCQFWLSVLWDGHLSSHKPCKFQDTTEISKEPTRSHDWPCLCVLTSVEGHLPQLESNLFLEPYGSKLHNWD